MLSFDAKILSYLSSMLWARTVQHRFGNISYGRIQKKLTQELHQTNSEYWEKCSGRLYKNSNGKTRVEGGEFINQIEGLLPGTKRILHLPLWKILADHNASLDQLYNYMKDLPPDIQNKLFKVEKETNKIKRIKIKSITVDYISKRNDLDALACLLMMIREAELTKQIDAYISCKWRAHHLFCRLATFQPFKSISNIIYDFIFDSFFKKNHPLPSSLSNIFVEYHPDHYTIPNKYPMPRFLDENLYILQLATEKNVIGKSIKEQLDFLFWIDFNFKRTEIIESLLMIPDLDPSKTISYPHQISELKKRMNGNSRNYLPKEQYIV